MLLSFHMQTFCGYIYEPVKFQSDIYRLSVNIESHFYVCSCLLCQNFIDMPHLIIVFCIALQTELRNQMYSSSKRKKIKTSY